MSDSQLAVPVAPSAMAPASPSSVGEMLTLAINKGATVEFMKGLLDLQERMENRDAERQFHDAMAKFLGLCPVMKKSKEATDTRNNGAKRLYVYADLPEISKTINPILATLGLSYSFDSKVDDKNLTALCTVRHRAGHSQTSSFVCPLGGGASPLPLTPGQKVGGNLTLAMRYALIQAFSLSSAEPDRDGRDPEDDGSLVNDEQIAQLQTAIDSIDSSGKLKAGFLRFVDLESLADIPASKFDDAMRKIEAKRKES